MLADNRIAQSLSTTVAAQPIYEAQFFERAQIGVESADHWKGLAPTTDENSRRQAQQSQEDVVPANLEAPLQLATDWPHFRPATDDASLFKQFADISFGDGWLSASMSSSHSP